MKRKRGKTYRIRQITPVTDYYSVYAQPVDGQRGSKCHLTAYKTELLAVCDVEDDDDSFSTISPVTLNDGFFSIDEEDSGYAGMCKEGDDIRHVTGNLNHQDHPLLPRYVTLERVSDREYKRIGKPLIVRAGRLWEREEITPGGFLETEYKQEFFDIRRPV